jgi:hypothetical protein
MHKEAQTATEEILKFFEAFQRRKPGQFQALYIEGESFVRIWCSNRYFPIYNL